VVELDSPRACIASTEFSQRAQGGAPCGQLVQQADRLAWLKNWTRAEPLYGEAQRLFAARGDRRNALYAEINALRGQLPRLPVAEVSQRLAEYLDDPLVQSDARLRLRTLVINLALTDRGVRI
jgi:hypothetical protein